MDSGIINQQYLMEKLFKSFYGRLFIVITLKKEVELTWEITICIKLIFGEQDRLITIILI